MDCPTCGQPTSDAARFCGECGAPLTPKASCPACGAQNPAGEKYCTSCGQRLGAGLPHRNDRPETPEHLARKIRAAGAALAGERKQEWDEAIAALGRARALHRESEVGWEEEPLVVAMLARARLGRGEVAAARELADEAIALATAAHTRIWELHARHQRALAALAGDEPDSLGVAETELRRALDVAAETGALAFEPRLRLALAEVAQRRRAPVG